MGNLFSLATSAFFIFWLFPFFAFASDLGKVGKTYVIVEPDILEEIHEQLKTKNIKILDIDTAKVYTLDSSVKLKKAKKPRVFTVDLTYTLEFDIKDSDGNILYPKGFTFNPFHYVTLEKTLIVIDGTNEKEITWFENSEYSKNQNVMLLITAGKYYELSSRLKRQVFYANNRIIEKFRLSATPSIIKQKGDFVEVTEIVVSSVD